MSETAVLPQGAGYGVVIGIGLFFSAFMVFVTYLQGRYTSYKVSSAEEFTSASRSVKPGLIASGIVSAWTWAATLLQSSAVAYNYGISGPWWYAAGATVQVLLFAQNAACLKLHAPSAHTFLEVVYCRWGRFSHLVLMGFALATNVIVSSMLITGSSATVSALTGMNTIAACVLIPLVVVLYVIVGGMRATLLCDYTHTTILFAIILTFMMSVYATNGKIGSPGAMFDLLTEAATAKPVAGNAHGSYLTMRSKEGLIFGVINIIGNFATVYNDQAYWQRAIASAPASAVKGFLLGGLAWFAVPFGFATTMGLTAVALQGTPAMPALTASQVSSGLAAPLAAAALLGKSGAATILVLLFLAVTSATSAELIAVSSVVTYDVYKTYINPHATEKQVLWVSHIAIAGWGVAMAVLGIIFYEIGISMGWLYLFMGTILGGAVAPIAMCIMWSKANRLGCTLGALAGLASGMIAWLVTCSTLNGGVINVTTTGQNYPMLAGNLASIGVSCIISTVTSLLWPENFDFAKTRELKMVEQLPDGRIVHHNSMAQAMEDKLHSDEDISDKKSDIGAPTAAEVEEAEREKEALDIDAYGLQKAFKFAVWASVVLFVLLILVIPLPLFFSHYVFPKGGFATWVAVAFIWVFLGAFTVVLYPVFESRVALAQIFKGMLKDVVGGGAGKTSAPTAGEQVADKA